MYRFIPVMRAVLVEETQGNSNGFLIRFLSSVSFGSAKLIDGTQHQGGHHQLPGQGSPTERYPYYDNRFSYSSIGYCCSRSISLGLGTTATLAKRVGTNPCQGPSPGGPRGLQALPGKGAPAWQPTTTQCLQASRACTRVKCRVDLTGS